MNRRILFSPVGNTDPIKYLRDGSMLHICRFYRPDIVYLYFSKEMEEHQKTDGRYTKTLELLGEHLGHSFEIRPIFRSDLVDVQHYDIFYKEFRDEIREIAAQMEPGDELFLNMASGTPAMKSALLIIATLTEYRFRPIQVSSPQRRSNSEYEERSDYDVQANWELNEDNEPDAENRCEEIKCLNLLAMLKKDMMKKHLLAFDYHAALEIGMELGDDLEEEALALLHVAAERANLNGRVMDQWLNKYHFDIIPVKEGNKRKLFEYALVLQIKLKRKEYADFLRAITPLVLDLYLILLEKSCRISVEQYSYTDRKGVCRWDRKKLEGNQVLQALEQEWPSFDCGPVSSIHIKTLIRAFSNDRELNEMVEEISAIEQKLRNVAAHEIVSVTAEWSKRETGKTPEDIMKLIRRLCAAAGISSRKEDWGSYDAMNRLIIERLQ